MPALRGTEVLGTYSGLRPATEHRDYQIAARPAHRWITVGGIRSTGLTGAPGIAEYVGELCAPPPDPRPPRPAPSHAPSPAGSTCAGSLRWPRP